MSYPNPLLAQLLQDPSFTHWVFRTDDSAVAKWEQWIASHPEHREMVAEAAQMVRGVPFARRAMSEGQVAQSWHELQQQLKRNQPSQRLVTLPWFRAAAAAVIILSGLVGWLVLSSQWENPTYATSYGETREITLPDGSHVTLNAHSRLRYQMQDEPPHRREVFLDGEAFFSVVHKNDHQPFVVQTRDLHVQVLGTEFNVNTRRGRTQVVLDDGHVELQLANDAKAEMEPGELVEYQADNARLHKETVNPQHYTGWLEKKLTFDDTPLQEVALLLEENYGVEVVFDDPQLSQKKVTGEISAHQLDTILRALSKLFSITIQHTGTTVRIAATNVTP